MFKFGYYSSFENGQNMCVDLARIAPWSKQSPVKESVWFPTTSQKEEICFRYHSPKYPKTFSCEHAGADYCRQGGAPVYAICNGFVEKNYTDQTNYFLKLLVIKHTYGGTQFWGHYGHISSSLKEGQTVQGGDMIGEIIDVKGYTPHLHFGLNITKMHTIYAEKDAKGRKYGWGRTPTGVSPDTVGWRDPDLFLKNPADVLRS